MTQTPYSDGSHDPVTGAYIKPADRVSAASSATADQYTITEDYTEPVSVGTSYNDYNPDVDPRVHPEMNTDPERVSVGTSAGGYDPAVYNVPPQPSYDEYAAAVDYSVNTMPPSPVPHYDPLPEVLGKLDEINRKLDHLLEHQHQSLSGTIHLDPPPKVGAGYTT